MFIITPNVFLMDPIPACFSVFSSFQYILLIQLIVNKICRWLDSKSESMVLEATTLPTEPQPPPPIVSYIYYINCKGEGTGS